MKVENIHFASTIIEALILISLPVFYIREKFFVPVFIEGEPSFQTKLMKIILEKKFTQIVLDIY